MIVVRFGICFDRSSTAKSSVAETALQHRRVPLGIISCVQPHQLVEGLVFWAGRNPLTLRERALHSRAHRSEAFAFASMQGTHIPVVGVCLCFNAWHSHSRRLAVGHRARRQRHLRFPACRPARLQQHLRGLLAFGCRPASRRRHLRAHLACVTMRCVIS